MASLCSSLVQRLANSDVSVADFTGQVPEPHYTAVANRQGCPDHVTQLADIAGPAIGEQPLKGIDLNGCRAPVAGLGREKLANQPFLVGALGEWRQLERDSVQTIVKILAKLPTRDHCPEVL